MKVFLLCLISISVTLRRTDSCHAEKPGPFGVRALSRRSAHHLYAKEINLHANDETERIVEITLFAPDDQIEEKAVTQMLDAPNDLEACVKRGYAWLGRHG